MNGEVRLLKVGLLADLEGALTHSGGMAISLEETIVDNLKEGDVVVIGAFDDWPEHLFEVNES
jgi:hypothetical protein